MRAFLAVAAVVGVFIGVLWGGGRLLGVWGVEPSASPAREGGRTAQAARRKHAPKKRVGGPRAQVRFRPADRAAARAAILQRGDFAPGSGWRGGLTKGDSSTVSCANFRPKRSDLVVTGAASSSFSHPGGVTLMTAVEVMRTREMLERDWQRTLSNRNFAPCIRRQFAKQKSEFPTRIVSLKRLRFPRHARFTAAFRLLVDVRTPQRRVRMIMDLVLIGGNRTELTFAAIGPYASRAALVAAEKRVLRRLLSRARA